MAESRFEIRQRVAPLATLAFWTGLFGVVVPVTAVILAALLANLTVVVVGIILMIPLVSLIGRAFLLFLRQALRPGRLVVDQDGITLDSLGETWRFGWDEIVWIGVEMGAKGRGFKQSLVAVLEPDAPPVRTRLVVPPVRLPKQDHVWLFDLLTTDRDPVEATNAVERYAGPKWRAEPITWT